MTTSGLIKSNVLMGGRERERERRKFNRLLITVFYICIYVHTPFR